MARSSLVSVCLASALVACSLAVCCSGAALTYPTVIRSNDAVWAATITVEAARHVDAAVAFNTRLFCYLGACTFPGPTIEMKPGDTFSLTVVNNLGPETGVAAHNYMHWPNTTNMHTHGLHIDAATDSVFIKIAPGQSHTYVYKLPANHAPGLHWYHTHMHGSSTFDVMGGLHGALFVAPTTANTENIPASYTAMPKHLLVLSHIQFSQTLDKTLGTISQGCANGAGCTVWQGCSATQTNSPFHPFRSYSYLEMSPEVGNQLAPEPVYAGGTPVNQIDVNGQYRPTVTMAVNEKRIFQFVQTAGSVMAKLRLPSQCTFNIVAIDGVFLRSLQLKANDFWMNQAGRWEVQVSCATAGTYSIDEQFLGVIMYVEVTGSATAVTGVTTAELALIVRPNYLADLTAAPVQSRYALHFSQGGTGRGPCNFWLGGGSDCTAIWKGTKTPTSVITADNTCPFLMWPGQIGGNGTDPYQDTWLYKHVTAVGQTNEWKIYGLGMDTHPFHVHVNHFQIISYTPSTLSGHMDHLPYFQIGEWRDTIPALDGELTVRFVASDYPGETIFHCHFLRHEDLGMMSQFYVCDPNTPGACPSTLDTSTTGGTSSSTTTGAAGTTTAGATSTGGEEDVVCADMECAGSRAAPTSTFSLLLALGLATFVLTRGTRMPRIGG